MRVDYDRISGRYDRSRNFGEEFTRELLTVLPEGFAPAAALDAGCGTGNATRCLREAFPAARVFGLDKSAGMLSRAREKLPGVALVRADATLLPCAPGRFDLVLSAYMIHHLDRPDEFLAGAAAALVPGGRLVVLTAGHDQIRAHFLNRFFPRFAEIDCARFPSLDRVETEMRAAGLRPGGRRELTVAEYDVDESYLERVRGRHISTFELMPEEEFSSGLGRITAWVAACRAAGGQMPRHAAKGTLLLATRPDA